MSDALDGEYLTIPAAARRLGMSERTAARYAAKLPESDRQESANGRHRLVRVAAMAAILAEQGKQAPAVAATDGSHMAADGGNVADSTTPAALLAEKDVRIELLTALLSHEQAERRADNERWSKTHDEAQRLQDQAQRLLLADRAEIRELRRKLEEAEEVKLALIEAKQSEPPAADSGRQLADSEARNIAQDSPGADSTGDRASGGTITPPDSATAAKPGFWARLFGKG